MQHNKSHLKPYILSNLDEPIWAYIAGIVDGEAHIRLWEVRRTTEGPNYGFEISIAQIDRRLLVKLREWLKVGYISNKSSPNKNPIYIFCIKRRLAVGKILKKIYKYLIVKQKIAGEIISHLERVYGKGATHA